MNRLIIVGNGFDKAHGLDSDYYSFIQNYLHNAIVKFIENNNFDDLLISIQYAHDNSYRRKFNISDIDEMNVFNTIQEFKKRGSIYDIEFKCKSDFFEEICIDAEKKWVDIERTYYKHLIKLFDEIKNEEKITESTLEPIKLLNGQMNHLKTLLEEYLYKQEQEKFSNASVRKVYLFSEFHKDVFLSHTWKDLEKQQSEKNEKESETITPYDGKIKPEKVLILNFNYTNPFKRYGENYDIVNIHGLLKSREFPIVFGYGDERDDKYLELEKSGIDEFLKNIKSFAYFQNQNYDELLGFIELNDFEVWIAGHSCGLSDKTLLAQIFEHKFCKSIRVFYHEKDGKDNYNEIVYNIARVMSDKIKMRGILTPKSHYNKFEVVGGIIHRF